ncbi:hypothetical protein JCM33374_g3697 [Metschnikowia sp. JCM 33374]|nr:hypothetical protein JCM33374_g3697 [Metschnikowia sp. JCM 33374]
MATQENVDKMLEIIQASLTPEQMFEISKKVGSKGRGKKSLVTQDLRRRHCLPNYHRWIKKEIKNTGVSEFQNFEKQASELTEMHFRRVVRDTISAYKRTETFGKYSHISIKDILTTKDYEMSDFKTATSTSMGLFSSPWTFQHTDNGEKFWNRPSPNTYRQKILIDCLGNIQIIKG